jgi:hypothetical protein
MTVLIALKKLEVDSSGKSCKHTDELFDSVIDREFSGQLNEDCFFYEFSSFS